MMTKREFSTEFAKWTSYLKGFAYNLTRDKHLAEDLYQDTAVAVFRNQDKFSSGTNMKAWLGVIMRNLFINGYRKKKRRGLIFDNSKESYLLNDGAKRVNNEGEGNIVMKEMLDLINDLPDGLRIPFVMTYEGYKYEEIASYIKLPIGTVKSRIFQARKVLKEKLSLLYRHPNPRELAI
jgi:RNA polymerase sigma-70 factor (ECF subfamily)